MLLHAMDGDCEREQSPGRCLQRTRDLLLMAVDSLQGTPHPSAPGNASPQPQPTGTSMPVLGLSSLSFLPSCPSIASTTKALEVRNSLFHYGGQRRRAPAEKKNKPSKRKRVETWTHDFFCLADTAQNCTPLPLTVGQLMNAGLGKKRIGIVECGDSTDMHEEILSSFSALKAVGGYEVMRVSKRQRNKLEVIPVPLQGYTPHYLKEVARQAKIYIRPLQHDPPLKPLPLDLLDTVSLQCRNVISFRSCPLRCMMVSDSYT